MTYVKHLYFPQGITTKPSILKFGNSCFTDVISVASRCMPLAPPTPHHTQFPMIITWSFVHNFSLTRTTSNSCNAAVKSSKTCGSVFTAPVASTMQDNSSAQLLAGYSMVGLKDGWPLFVLMVSHGSTMIYQIIAHPVSTSCKYN